MAKIPMMVMALLAVAIPQACSGAGAREARREGPNILVLEHVAVFDSMTGRFRPDRALVIENGLIVGEFAAGRKPLPAGAETRALADMYVIPGLIDTHVHIASDPSGYDRRAGVEGVLLKALRGGVTFVRDMAGDGRALADLNRAIAAGDIVAPGLRYAALMAGPAFFSDPRTIVSAKGETPGRTPWGRAVTESTDLTLAVAEGHGTGASAIKIYTRVDPALLARIAAEAHRQGLAVWSHAAPGPSKPGDAVSAGVDVISHADQLVWEAMPDADPGPRQLARRWLEEDVRRVAPDHPAILALLKRMKERGTILDATVSLYQASIRSVEKESPQYLSVVKATAAFASAVTRMAHEMGVEVCAGTDGIFESDDAPLPALHREMAVLVEDCGFTPAEALIAATRVAARALGISKTHGTIGPGMAADLVILQADPTADIHNSAAIELVIKSGRPVPREGGRQPLTDR